MLIHVNSLLRDTNAVQLVCSFRSVGNLLTVALFIAGNLVCLRAARAVFTERAQRHRIESMKPWKEIGTVWDSNTTLLHVVKKVFKRFISIELLNMLRCRRWMKSAFAAAHKLELRSIAMYFVQFCLFSPKSFGSLHSFHQFLAPFPSCLSVATISCMSRCRQSLPL